MTEFISVYITAATPHEAETIAQALVGEKLAACVNIIPNTTSIYRWEGEVTASSESIMLAKTRADLFPRLENRVRQLSSYDCPCIVALPLVKGHQPYLDWLTQQVK